MGVKNYIDQKGNLYFYLMPSIKWLPIQTCDSCPGIQCLLFEEQTGGHLVGSINIEAWIPRAPPHGDSQHFNAN